MDCGPPGSSVHGILQAAVPEWVAVSFSRRSSQPRGSSLDLLHLLIWQSDLLPGKPLYTGLPYCRRILYPAEPQEKLKYTAVSSLSLLQRIFPTPESKRGLLPGRRILYQPSSQGSPLMRSRLSLSIPDPHLSSPPFPHPTGHPWFVLYICECVSVFLYLFVFLFRLHI